MVFTFAEDSDFSLSLMQISEAKNMSRTQLGANCVFLSRIDTQNMLVADQYSCLHFT